MTYSPFLGFRGGRAASRLSTPPGLSRAAPPQRRWLQLARSSQAHLNQLGKKAAAIYTTRKARTCGQAKFIKSRSSISTSWIAADQRGLRSDLRGGLRSALKGISVRTGTVNNLQFREPVTLQMELLFIRNPAPRQRAASTGERRAKTGRRLARRTAHPKSEKARYSLALVRLDK
jgi:hypothetical protein